MSTATQTVRIRPETHRILRKLARESKRTLPDILEAAITEYDRRLFWEGVTEDYARLRADPKLWKEELEERALWDCTLMDGLKDDPPYPMEAMLSPRERAEQERIEQQESEKPAAKAQKVQAPQRALRKKGKRAKVEA